MHPPSTGDARTLTSCSSAVCTGFVGRRRSHPDPAETLEAATRRPRSADAPSTPTSRRGTSGAVDDHLARAPRRAALRLLDHRSPQRPCRHTRKALEEDAARTRCECETTAIRIRVGPGSAAPAEDSARHDGFAWRDPHRAAIRSGGSRRVPFYRTARGRSRRTVVTDAETSGPRPQPPRRVRAASDPPHPFPALRVPGDIEVLLAGA
jgi:hypothetical protein